ncbi:hypothetical protein TNCV_819981 [Trichonephila clavipes]|nr:hypothetical protein TNCV_819981 [Trichonephila clavipes]
MDQIDLPEHTSTTVVLEKPDALEYAPWQGQVRACIIYQEPNTKRVFVWFCKDNWPPKKTLVDNFKGAIMEAKQVNELRPDDVLWEKISKGLLKNPDRPLKNADKRMVYIYNNMFFCKKKILLLASERLRCRANPNLFKRSFQPFDQMLYHRMVLEIRSRLEAKNETVRSKLPPPTLAHVPAETNKRSLEEQPGPSSMRFPNRSKLRITPSVAPA